MHEPDEPLAPAPSEDRPSSRAGSRSQVYCVALALVLAVVAPYSCGPTKTGSTTRQDATLTAETIGGGGRAPVDPRDLSQPPTTAGSERGLELVTAGSALDQATLAALLAPYLSEPLPFPASTIASWQSNGLRVVSVPIDQLSALATSLSTVGSPQRQWLGEPAAWTELAAGPERRAQLIALDAERLELSPGRLRLLARAWLVPLDPAASAAPDGRPRAALHIELIPQHQESLRRSDAIDPTLRITEPTLQREEEGLLFTRLSANASLLPGRALVIVPERPGVDWRKLAAVAPERGPDQPIAPTSAGQASPSDNADTAGGEGGASPAVGKVSRTRPGVTDQPSRAREPRPAAPDGRFGAGATGFEQAGPEAPVTPTLGQAMLIPTPEAEAGTPAPEVKTGPAARVRTPARPVTRTILFLIPRVPERFSLQRD